MVGAIRAEQVCRCPPPSPNHPRPNHAYPMEDQCEKYIYCDAAGKPSVHNCLEGLHFNRKTLECDYPANARCAPEYHVKCE